MKKNCIIILWLFLFSLLSLSQNQGANQLGGILSGGIGISMIENDEGKMEAWYNVNIKPELSFGNFGLGLNVNLLINSNGDIRKEDLKLGKIIRYGRYGHKGSPLYVRVGALDAATLGHGFIMYRYSNQVQESNTRVGLEFDFIRDKFGIETVTSNLGDINIFGIRGHYKPLKDVIDIPVIKNFKVGATFVGDFSDDISYEKDKTVKIFGADMELPIIETKAFSSALYSDFATIVDRGNGFTFGINANMNLIVDILNASAKFERIISNKKFVPQYFNSFYEIERAYKIDSLHVSYKYDNVKYAPEMKGWFGELGATILNTVNIVGNYQKYDVDKTGIMYAYANTKEIIPNIVFQASYTKKNIDSLSDAFSLDENSLTAVDLGYKPYPYMTVFLRYEWTYRYNSEKDRYDTVEKIIPRLEFSYSF